MNKTYKYVFGAFVVASALVACSPEEYDSVNVDNVPSTADYKAQIDVKVVEEPILDNDGKPTGEVDKTTYATYTLVNADGSEAVGVYPIWYQPNGQISTQQGLTKSYLVAGTYKFSWKVATSSNISQDIQNGTFDVVEGIDVVDLMSKLTGNGSKQWRVYANKKGHIGLGESLEKADGWWSATPQEKVSEGIYDDVFTLTATDLPGSLGYKYEPGVDGNTFIRGEVTVFGENLAGGNDWSIPVVSKEGAKTESNVFLGKDKKTGLFTLEMPANVIFPWITKNDMYNKGMTFWIKKIDGKTMTLAWPQDLTKVENGEDPGMWFQMILVNGEDPVEEGPFDPNNVEWAGVNDNTNLGKCLVDANAKSIVLMDDYVTHVEGGSECVDADGVHTLKCHANLYELWRGQWLFENQPIAFEEGEYYDYSFEIRSLHPTNMKLTFKIEKPNTGGSTSSIAEDGIEVGTDWKTVRFAKRLNETGFDGANVCFALGAGCVDGDIYEICNIIIQKHNPKK